MIYYVVTRAHVDVLTTYLDTWGRRFYKTIRPVFYEDLPFYRTLPAGTYVFTDLEMLGPQWLELAAAVWASLATAGPACPILNAPTAVLPRFELLQALHEAGLNEFAVYRADQIDGPLNFPVFVRRNHEHDGSLTPLLTDQPSLDRAVSDLAKCGTTLNDLLVIEFCDTADAAGIYRKYSAMKVGDRILRRHLLVGSQWVLKYPDRVDAAAVEEERKFLQNDPHAAELAAIFKLANVDFGRIDYSLKDGRVQTWEINSNPTLVVAPDQLAPARLAGQAAFVHQLADAFGAIDTVGAGRSIVLNISQPLREALGATTRERWRRRLSNALGNFRDRVDRSRRV